LSVRRGFTAGFADICHGTFAHAILATDDSLRALALLTQGSPSNVRVFTHRQEAADWLKVPIELLAGKSE
jgi:hypothetical protein